MILKLSDFRQYSVVQIIATKKKQLCKNRILYFPVQTNLKTLKLLKSWKRKLLFPGRTTI